MTESPKYSVLKEHKGIEIRQYAGYIQAEVDIVAEDYKTAIRRGFDVLAGYIFGNNVSRQKIAMTTPVQASQSEKIAMTTPVTVTGDGNYKVAFIMPAEYTLESLPTPKDARIRLTHTPSHQTAAIRFSGYFNPETIRTNTEKLRLWLKEQGIESTGEFIVAGYNPPWIPGFLARNEVMVKIKSLAGG